MRRLFWVALGATVGILVVRRVSRAAQSYTPEGVARSLSGIGDGLRDLAATVREGMSKLQRVVPDFSPARQAPVTCQLPSSLR